MIQLRPYQERDLDTIRGHFRAGVRRVLWVSPTGSGKGSSSTFIIKGAQERGKYVQFWVNRRAIVTDQSQRLEKLGIDHGVIMAGVTPKPGSVQIASVDTLRNRELPPADLVILDEAHFAASDGYQELMARYPETRFLLMTATPIRKDGIGLNTVADVLVQGPQPQELIDQGYLVPSRVFAPNPPDLSSVPVADGDFNQVALAQVMNRAQLTGDIVKTWLRRASDRKTALFAVDKAHAHNVAEKFREAGVQATCVVDTTCDEDRTVAWNDFDNGTLKVICSVGVISFGWDHPRCDCIVIAAPTQSLARHLQRLGRGARPYPGKRDFICLDHAGDHTRMDMLYGGGRYEQDREWSLEGGGHVRRAGLSFSVSRCSNCLLTFEAGTKRCPECGAFKEVVVRKIKTAAGELQEQERKKAIIEAKLKEKTPDERVQIYRELVAKAKERGYSKKWAAVQYNIRFRQWPRGDWA